METDEERPRRESITAKDEQISLLKAVLIQLSDELQRKDERIAELEAQLSFLSSPSDKESQSVATAMTPLLACLQGGQGSSSEGGASSPMATTRRISSSDRLAMVPNLSPIEERGDGVFSQLSCDDDNAGGVTDSNRAAGGNERKSGNHSNKTTPRRRKISVLDREQQELQVAIATLDSTIAELELGSSSEGRLAALRRERSRLMADLNRKVQTRLRTVRRNSDDVFTKLATDYENFTRDQMCEAVRELDSAQARYKTYIDQLLAVVLETNSAFLEGMPRLQQSTGLRLDLLRVASRGELFEDIQERERNMASLELYATQLSERILNHALPLLPVLDPFQDSGDWDGMEPDTSSSLTEPMMS
jgi:hypothetical protein